MAAAVAEGARETGAHVDVKRVPELVSDKVARDSHFKIDQAAPVAKIDDLAAYDAIIVGTGTRSDGCRRKWPISWTRPAAFGCAGRCTERSAGLSPQPPRNMVGRKRRYLDHHQSLALRHGGRRPGLRPCRSDDP